MAAERLQKVLAALGVASRREAEAWIRAGRVTVNGEAAVLGQRVEEGDRIAVDGRRLRQERAAPADLVLIYHRPPGEALKASTAADAEAALATTFDRLPPVRGRRWLPLAPLGPTDGGLEVFTTDGELRDATSRASARLGACYAVRVAGEPTEALLAGLPAAARASTPPFEIERITPAGGEGRNRWLEFDVVRGHGRELRQLLATAGLEVSRILRTRFGPITMDRAISRGRHRELEDEERDALYVAVGLATPAERARRLRAASVKAGSRSASPRRPKRPAPRGRGRSR
ncbi:MAG TPA: S4 domain-containing protein [Steroidobacteraceae bacterium]|nr:S4 domain-containing protein [Steroidobacteraceae bacterium]